MKLSNEIRKVAQESIDDPHKSGSVWATAILKWADMIGDLEQELAIGVNVIRDYEQENKKLQFFSLP